MPARRRVEQGGPRTTIPAGDSNPNSKSTTRLNSYRSPQLHQAVEGTRDITEAAVEAHAIITGANFDLANLTYTDLNKIFLFLVEATMTSLSKPFVAARPRQMKNIFTSWALYWQKRNEMEVDPALRVAASSCSFQKRFPDVCIKLEKKIECWRSSIGTRWSPLAFRPFLTSSSFKLSSTSTLRTQR